VHVAEHGDQHHDGGDDRFGRPEMRLVSDDDGPGLPTHDHQECDDTHQELQRDSQFDDAVYR